MRRIVSPRLWKHAIVAGIVLAIGAAILALCAESSQVAAKLGPSAGRFVSLDQGRLLPFFNATLLALSAELSLLIWWVRSRSRTDFSGRFRIWRWASVVGFSVAACVFLDLHVIWSRTLIWRLKLDFAHVETLCWLAPAVGCGSVLIRDLMADMRICRASSAILWLAVLSWATSVALLFSGASILDNPHRLSLMVAATASFGHYCLFLSLQLHARAVIFISAEPPELRMPAWKRGLKAVVRFLGMPCRRFAETWRAKRESARNAGKRKRHQTADAAAASTQGEPSNRGRRQTKAFAPDELQDDSRNSADRDDAGTPPARSVAGRTVRFDEAHAAGTSSSQERERLPGSRKAKKRGRERVT